LSDTISKSEGAHALNGPWNMVSATQEYAGVLTTRASTPGCSVAAGGVWAFSFRGAAPDENEVSNSAIAVQATDFTQ